MLTQAGEHNQSTGEAERDICTQNIKAEPCVTTAHKRPLILCPRPSYLVLSVPPWVAWAPRLPPNRPHQIVVGCVSDLPPQFQPPPRPWQDVLTFQRRAVRDPFRPRPPLHACASPPATAQILPHPYQLQLWARARARVRARGYSWRYSWWRWQRQQQ